MSKQVRFYRNLRGCQQAVQGNDPLFQLFPQVVLFQVAGKVMLGK